MRPKSWVTVVATAVLLVMLVATTPRIAAAQAKSVDPDALCQCLAITDDAKRLACFDALARTVARPGPRPQMGSKGKWQVTSSASPIDDSTTVVLSLDAESKIEGWPKKTTLPTLILRCKERKTELYVATGMAPNVEYGTDKATVTLRFDKEPAGDVELTKSTDGEGLFFPEAVGVIKGMLGYNAMLFSFTPFNSSPVVTTFDLRGISEAVKPLREGCHW